MSKFRIEKFTVTGLIICITLLGIYSINAFPGRLNIKSLYQKFSDDSLPYSMMGYGFAILNLKNVPQNKQKKLNEVFKIPEITINENISNHLKLCPDSKAKVLIQIMNLYSHDTITNNYLEKCIRDSHSFKTKQYQNKQNAKYFKTIKNIFSIQPPKLLKSSISEKLIPGVKSLIDDWENYVFIYSNLNMHHASLNKIRYWNSRSISDSSLNNLLEDKIYNPLIKDDEKLNHIAKFKKNLEFEKLKKFEKYITMIEKLKPNIEDRNRELLKFFSSVTAYLIQNPNISDSSKNMTRDLLECFRSWDEEKLKLYSMDYYMNFFHEYHSMHHSLISVPDEESKKLMEYFDSVYFDSYFFEGRLKEIHSQCKKIQKM